MGPQGLASFSISRWPGSDGGGNEDSPRSRIRGMFVFVCVKEKEILDLDYTDLEEVQN